MSFQSYLETFCLEHCYTSTLDFNKDTQEYSIIISNEKENAGVWLTNEELQALSNQEIKDLLLILHKGIELRMQKHK